MIAAIAGLAGCDIGPKFLRPSVQPPKTWTSIDRKTPSAWPSAQWWHNFASPELDTLMAQAQTANFDLAAAAARIVEADAQARIAGAPLLPTIGGSGSLTREQVGQTTPGASAGPAFNTSTATITASYEIDFWGKNKAGQTSARAAALASRYDRETLALTVIGSVAATYFQILGLRDRVTAAEANIKISESVLDALRIAQQVGAGSALDVAQQETAVAALKAQVPPLRQQLQQAVDALAILIARPPQIVRITTAGLDGLAEPPVAPGLPSELLIRRPDIAEAEAQLVAANANIKAARAALFPSISLTAEGGVISTALNSIFSPGGTLWAITAGLTQPIFEGGKLQGQVEFSQARYTELEQTYKKAVVAAFSDAEDALVSVKETGLQVELLQDEVNKARRSYDIALAELKVGTSNLLTVLTIENTLFPAQDALIQARAAHYQAIVSLFKALGGGWQVPPAPAENPQSR